MNFELKLLQFKYFLIVPLVDVIQIMVAAFPDQVMEGIRKDEYLYAK